VFAMMSWKKAETVLYEVTASMIRRFAADHPSERFYGFIFDVNAVYGEVLLCLNTEAALSAWAAQQYPQYSPAEIDAQLRWNAGDWEYQGFNSDPPYAAEWEDAWADIQDSIHDACLEDDSEDVAEEFLKSVCRVLIRLESNSDFSDLNREPHFEALVSDHDEDLEESRERLARAREVPARTVAGMKVQRRT
jgi:hypothetical protein